VKRFLRTMAGYKWEGKQSRKEVVKFYKRYQSERGCGKCLARGVGDAGKLTAKKSRMEGDNEKGSSHGTGTGFWGGREERQTFKEGKGT